MAVATRATRSRTGAASDAPDTQPVEHLKPAAIAKRRNLKGKKKAKEEDATSGEKEPEDATVVKEEPEDATVVKEEPEDAIIVKEEPEDATLPKEELNDATVLKNEPQDANIVKTEPEDAVFLKEEPNDATATSAGNATAETTTLYVFLTTTSQWKSVVRVSHKELRELSKRPAKWLRYIGWCVYGAPGRLHISDDATSPEILIDAGADLDTDPGAPIPAVCYYISEDEPRYIDLEMLADRGGTNAPSTSPDTLFHRRIWKRDRRCVFMQASPNPEARMMRSVDCESAHIVPHHKGREYLDIMDDRHNVPEHQRLHGIDDPRNGIFIWADLRKAFGAGECAFLLVPNPYMDAGDVHEGAVNREHSHGIPDHDGTFNELEERELEATMEEENDDYSVSERSTVPCPKGTATEMAVKKEADVEGESGLPQASATLDQGMTDDSRLVLQWVGYYTSPIATSCVPNNTHAALRRGTQLYTPGLHRAYACAVINRWGRDLPDAPERPPPTEAQRMRVRDVQRWGRSPRFNSLVHSFIEPTIRAEYYPDRGAQNQPKNDSASAYEPTAAPRQREPDWAWQPMLRVDDAEQLMKEALEAAVFRHRMQRQEQIGKAKVAQWIRRGTIG
ncbi:hypothetical protein DFH06DRAFT_1118163 [Mycena polygramma]|nr:hypothetical protein DFH06DRAFT_1118163 [Mycena polygramma]